MYTNKPKRIRLSFLAARTQKLLFSVLCGFALTLACVQLFLMNNLSMKGYILSKITEEQSQITSELQKLDAQVARFETREYVSRQSEQKTMIVRHYQRYMVMKDTFTAQK
ncbi:hypothetical protein K9M59_00895 [Candidatus Gracilibacteria bacterium]|nr:hypothetical protein [Candidatus Gracilibacteria bacterium]MCF7819131.1 hypothetical protein [Candidatus Gracilibacteria bacterium]